MNKIFLNDLKILAGFATLMEVRKKDTLYGVSKSLFNDRE